MCITFSPPSLQKAQTMDTSLYVYDDDISIIMPYPKAENNGIKALLAPFQTKVK